MKILFLILFVSLFISNSQAEQKFKFENKVIETITIKDKNLYLDFKILCINGYQYLYVFGSLSAEQMFSTDKKSKQSVPISCNGFEGSDEK